MNSTYSNFYLTKEMSVYEAAQIIDKNVKRTAFLVEDDILLGAVSDSDLRRFLINRGNVNDSVTRIVNYSPRYLYEDNEVEDYVQYMLKYGISALPIVDQNKRIKRIVFLDNRKIVGNKIEAGVPVVIMAGGKGSRLKPYTDIIPKPLIPIGEKTITEHIVDRYRAFGCTTFYLIVNYKRNLIETYFKETSVDADLFFVEEISFQGTAGGLSLLPQEIGENFFVTNCDILVDANYCEIYDEHMDRGNIITIVTAKKVVTIPYGTIQTNEKGEVVSLTEKPSYHFKVNTGMYLCSRKILQYIKEGENLDMPALIQRCMDSGESVGTYQVMSDEWSDMGQSEELNKMKKNLNLV